MCVHIYVFMRVYACMSAPTCTHILKCIRTLRIAHTHTHIHIHTLTNVYAYDLSAHVCPHAQRKIIGSQTNIFLFDQLISLRGLEFLGYDFVIVLYVYMYVCMYVYVCWLFSFDHFIRVHGP